MTFKADFDEWRKNRPEWNSLAKAVRDDKPASELADLAEAAGASDSELRDLLYVRRTAKQRQPAAARFPEEQKKLEAAEAELNRLKALAETATADEHATVMEALARAADMRHRAYSAFIGPAQAEKYIREVAQPLGLI